MPSTGALEAGIHLQSFLSFMFMYSFGMLIMEPCIGWLLGFVEYPYWYHCEKEVSFHMLWTASEAGMICFTLIQKDFKPWIT